MKLKRLLEEKNISIYRLSKITEIPYMTLNDLVNEKNDILKCNSVILYKIARALDVSMEYLLESYLNRTTFENFKSNVCQEVKAKTDCIFILDVIKEDRISTLFNKDWYPEALYLLAMVDYLSRVNNIPLCNKYDYLRTSKLKDIIYPSSLVARAKMVAKEDILKTALSNSIPEFSRFNIVENNIRDVA